MKIQAYRADYEFDTNSKICKDVLVLAIYHDLISLLYHLIIIMFMNEWILTRFLFCFRSSLLFYLRYSQNSTVEKVSDLLFNLSFCSLLYLCISLPRFFVRLFSLSSYTQPIYRCTTQTITDYYYSYPY